ncbi:hypothetical protein F383_01866 [Gossypium arboreum]|uniref:Uncharacterized protein n=1 Tax=Gossypium arboreum TaxID=29729 RepID=A0A0B0P936_GOSAR|nr:hypothetical protein F383_01866 [Gossypium arboreum]
MNLCFNICLFAFCFFHL